MPKKSPADLAMAVEMVLHDAVHDLTVAEYIETLEEIEANIEARLDAARDDLRREQKDAEGR